MKTRLGWSGVLIFGFFGGAACGVEATATLLNNPPRPFKPRSPGTVEMYSGAPPTRPHIDVALIESDEQSEDAFASTAKLLAKMREQAAELGCDALVIGGEHSNHDALLSAVTGRTHQARGWSGTCIMYTDAGPNQAIATAAPTVPLPPPSAPAAHGG